MLAVLLCSTFFNETIFLGTAYAATKSVTFPDGNRTQSTTITIPNLLSVNSVTSNNGNVSFTRNGNNITITVSNGKSTSSSSYTPSKVASTTLTSSTDSFPATTNYNDGTYSGSIPKSGSSSKNLVSGTYIPADTKTATDTRTASSVSGLPNTVPSPIAGYSGTLSKSGTYTKTQTGGSAPDSKSVSGIQGSLYWASLPNLGHNCTEVKHLAYDKVPSTMFYSDGSGYSGTLTLDGRSYRDYCSNDGNGNLETYAWGYYSGTISTKDTRTYSYTQAYSGLVTRPESDTRVYNYTQGYSGTVYAPTQITYYYGYSVIIDYTDDLPPTSTTYDYVYDTLNRLQYIKESGVVKFEFIYDQNGNVIEIKK